jgi:hypothetical protein
MFTATSVEISKQVEAVQLGLFDFVQYRLNHMWPRVNQNIATQFIYRSLLLTTC